MKRATIAVLLIIAGAALWVAAAFIFPGHVNGQTVAGVALIIGGILLAPRKAARS